MREYPSDNEKFAKTCEREGKIGGKKEKLGRKCKKWKVLHFVPPDR